MAMNTGKDRFSDLGTLAPSSASPAAAPSPPDDDDDLPAAAAPPAVAPAPEPASVYQHYQVLRRADGSLWELGRGAMGITYKAFDVNLRCDVALKVVNAAMLHHPNARERFVREARAAARLRHRNVATVYHLGNDGEHFFYAMEFVDGETLESLVRRAGPLAAPAALRVVLQAARALAAAARQGLVHRDIKPANVMLAHEDADDHAVVKVIDFGLVRPTLGDGSGSLTIGGGFVGTPQFASPEQLEEQPVDTRSDIYSLGVTFWFLLAGQPPFVGSLASICDQHRHAPPPWDQLPALAQQPSVRALLARMLEKNPANRPQDAVELRREAEAALAGLLGRSALSAEDEEAPWPTAPLPASEEAAPASTSARVGSSARAPSSSPARRTISAAAAEGGSVSALAVGSMVGGRYELIQLIDESDGSRVFQARDRKAGGRLAAVKQRRAGAPSSSSVDAARLAEEVRHARAAAHPCLVEIYALEPSASPSQPPCLVEEWINGFTLLDLLAVRATGGVSPPEGLCLLQQAALASDHARRYGLGRLGLALHQLRLHFLDSLEASAGPEARAALRRPMSAWKPWTLKIDPLGVAHSRAESATWAGEATLLPGAGTMLRQDDPTAAPDLCALARLIYELLGGTPPPPAASDAADDAARAARYPSLPALNEEANAVLRRALSAKTAFQSGRDFFESLARAAGIRPENLSAHGGGLATAAPSGGDGGDGGAPWQDRFQSAAAETFAPVGGNGAGASAASGKKLSTLPMGRRERAAVSRRRRFWVAATVWALLLCAGAAALMWRQQRLPASKPRGNPSAPVRKKAAGSGKSSPEPSASPAARKPTPRPTRAPAASTPAAAPTPAPLPKTLDGNNSAAVPVPAASAPPALARPASTPPPPEFIEPSSPPPVFMPTPAATVAVVPPPPTSSLAPMPSKERTVRLRVESVPEGAEISIPGEATQKTPMEMRLPPGEYELVARYRDWADVRYQFRLPKDKREAKIDIRMVPPVAPATEPAEPAAKGGRSWLPHFGKPRPSSAAPSARTPTPEPGGVDNVVAPASPGGEAPVLSGRPVEAMPPPSPSPRVLRALPKTEPFEPAPPDAPSKEPSANSSEGRPN